MNTERTILAVLMLFGLFCAWVEAQTPPPSIIAMGASTGGTEVFPRVLVDLDRCAVAGWTIPPVVIVQHAVDSNWVNNNVVPLMSQGGLTVQMVPVP